MKGCTIASKSSTQNARAEWHFYVRAITRHCNASKSELGDTQKITLPHHILNLVETSSYDNASTVSRTRRMFFLQELKPLVGMLDTETHKFTSVI